MKRNYKKISMAVAAMVMFAGVLLLNVEMNEHGRWEMGIVSSFAQGGESGGDPTCGKFIADGSTGIEYRTSLQTVLIVAQSVSFNANAEGSMGGRSVKVGTQYANKTVPISQGYYKECEDFDLFNQCDLANEGYMIPCP